MNSAAHAIDGHAEPRFDLVRMTFAENFATRGEIGAGVAIYLDGEPVVDLWGGRVVEDGKPGAAWQRDTLVGMMSVNKAVTAICAHRLADQGLLDYEKPVVYYWPEFAQAGKEAVTVRQVMGGLAALVFPDEVPAGKVFDWEAMIEGLSKQVPAWPVGTKGAYHSSTYGHLVGELVRLISGQRVEDYFRSQIADPMDLDYWFVVPPSQRHRVSELLPNPDSVTANAVAAGGTNKIGRAWRILPRPDVVGVLNDPQYAGEVMPSGFGRGNARALGKLFAALSVGGELDGFRIMSPDTLKAATTLQCEGECGLTDRPFRYALGLFLNSPGYMPMGPNLTAFGHAGAGGSLGFADPENRLAFSYCTNFMCGGAGVGDRCEALVDAAYEALSA